MPNPLLAGIETVHQRIAALKAGVREFYFDVLMSLHSCPECDGKMRMTGPSRCACECGVSLDPTVAFQRSQCCGAALVKRRCHYACSSCRAVQPSRFLFDERLFDPDYFRERMRVHRQERKRKREALKRLLADSHSDTWFAENPAGFDLPLTLCRDLDEHIAAVREVYSINRNAIVDAAGRWFPEGVTITRPKGGMFIWVTLPDGMPAMELYRKAAERHVAFIPGEAFFVDGGGKSEFRLNFSNVDLEKIEPGIKRLGEAITEMME